MVPRGPLVCTGKKVAVIGSGPAGLAAADQLNKAGHIVTVFEKADRIGGLLRYGIPEFKMEKRVLNRRLSIMEQESVLFRTSVNVCVDVTPAKLKSKYYAIMLSGGACRPPGLHDVKPPPTFDCDQRVSGRGCGPPSAVRRDRLRRETEGRFI